MRTPEEYIEDQRDDVLSPFMSNIPTLSLALNDQYHAELQQLAHRVGVNPESIGFKASMLLACDLIDGLAGSLENTEIEGGEIGAHFIREASYRLRLLTLWGEPCHNQTCLDLR